MRRLRMSIILIICAVAIFVMIVDSATAVSSAREAIQLCLETVIPSLFPMCVLTSILTDGLIGKTTQFISDLLKICKIPKGSESVLIAGFIGGYPLGAKLVSNFYEDTVFNQKQAEWLLSFCSNVGPAFVFGLCGMLFTSPLATATLWSIQICSAILVACVSRGGNTDQVIIQNRKISQHKAITGSISAMATISAWIILFRVVLGFADRWFLFMLPNEMNVIIKCFFELTCGIVSLPSVGNEQLRFVICSVALSFGGICVAMQTALITAGLGIKPYMKGKILQAIISFILVLCCLKQVYSDGIGIYVAPLLPPLFLIFTVFFQKTMAFSKTIIYNTRKTVRGHDYVISQKNRTPL